MNRLPICIALLGALAAGCTATPKPGTRVKVGPVAPLPMPFITNAAGQLVQEQFRAAARPAYVTIPQKPQPAAFAPASLLPPVPTSSFDNHFIGLGFGGPETAFPGDTVPLTGTIINLCRFGDSATFDSYTLSIVREGEEPWPVQNVIAVPLPVPNGSTTTVVYPLLIGQERSVTIWAELRAHDLGNNSGGPSPPQETTQAHRIVVERPLSIRAIPENRVAVRFRTYTNAVAHLDTSMSLAGPWQLAESIPPQDPVIMVTREYPANDQRRYFRLRNTP